MGNRLIVFSLLLLKFLQVCNAWPGALVLQNRQVTGYDLSTCGYLSGDSTKPRTAAPNFHCAIDASYAIWGFCTNTVQINNAVNCGLQGRCTDAQACTSGCGRPAPSPGAQPIYNILSCAGTQVCSSDFLVFNNLQYTAIGCGDNPGGDTLYALPTTTKVTTTSPQSSTSSSSVSPGSTAAYSGPTATSSQTTAAGSTADNGGSKNTGIIVGSVLGGIALICLTVIVVVLLRRRNAAKANNSNVNSAGGLGYDTHSVAEKRQDSPYVQVPAYSHYPAELDASQESQSPVEMGHSARF